MTQLGAAQGHGQIDDAVHTRPLLQWARTAETCNLCGCCGDVLITRVSVGGKRRRLGRPGDRCARIVRGNLRACKWKIRRWRFTAFGLIGRVAFFASRLAPTGECISNVGSEPAREWPHLGPERTRRAISLFAAEPFSAARSRPAPARGAMARRPVRTAHRAPACAPVHRSADRFHRARTGLRAHRQSRRSRRRCS
ncbi:hypothetical protein SAMN05216509_1007 [Pseudomonas sp. B10]|nr:hypothetical protein SAMN05216509_1007 [Pseudomonas sp. B10]